MFGIGGPEVFVILVIALLFVGPDKLPQVAKTVGTGLRDLRRMVNVTQTELQSVMTDLAREVERIPEAKAKADLDRKLAELTEHVDADGFDKTPPTRPSSVPPPVDGETIAVVQKRVPPPDDQAPAPAPTYVLTPADGARERMGNWPVHPDAIAESAPKPHDAAPEEVPPA